MAFCNLRITCVDLRVCLAPHHKSVYASSFVQSGVDLRLRLARALLSFPVKNEKSKFSPETFTGQGNVNYLVICHIMKDNVQI